MDAADQLDKGSLVSAQRSSSERANKIRGDEHELLKQSGVRRRLEIGTGKENCEPTHCLSDVKEIC